MNMITLPGKCGICAQRAHRGRCVDSLLRTIKALKSELALLKKARPQPDKNAGNGVSP